MIALSLALRAVELAFDALEGREEVGRSGREWGPTLARLLIRFSPLASSCRRTDSTAYAKEGFLPLQSPHDLASIFPTRRNSDAAPSPASSRPPLPVPAVHPPPRLDRLARQSRLPRLLRSGHLGPERVQRQGGREGEQGVDEWEACHCELSLRAVVPSFFERWWMHRVCTYMSHMQLFDVPAAIPNSGGAMCVFLFVPPSFPL